MNRTPQKAINSRPNGLGASGLLFLFVVCYCTVTIVTPFITLAGLSLLYSQ